MESQNATSWFEGLTSEDSLMISRKVILQRVKNKLGFNRFLAALGIARDRCIIVSAGIRGVPDEVVQRELCGFSVKVSL